MNNRSAFYEAMSRNPRMQEAAQSGGLTGAGFQQMFPYGAGNYAFGRAPLPEPAPGSPEQERYLTDLVSNMVFPLSVVGAEGRVGPGLVGSVERSVLPDVAKAKGGFLPKDSPERAENFRRWFGESKVVDDEGNPLTVYHGTDADFSEFKNSALGESTGHNAAGLGHFFSSPSVAGEFSGYDGASIIPANISLKNPKVIPADEFQEMLFGEEAAARALDDAKDAFEDEIGERITIFDDGLRFLDEETGQDMPIDYESLTPDARDMYDEINRLIELDPRDQEFGYSKQEWDSFKKELIGSGHDGIVVDSQDFSGGDYNIGQAEELMDDNYIVFNPEDIKSIFNRGTYDPKDPNIMRGLIGPGLATGATLTKGNNKNGKTK